MTLIDENIKNRLSRTQSHISNNKLNFQDRYHKHFPFQVSSLSNKYELYFCRTLTFKKNCFIFFNENPLKMMKKAFYFILKLFSFSRYLNFCADFLAMSKKHLDQKYKVNFKIYDITTCLINNYNTHIAQYFFFSIIITMYIELIVTNILKLKVNKTRQHRTQNLRKIYFAFCKFCTQIEHKERQKKIRKKIEGHKAICFFIKLYCAR